MPNINLLDSSVYNRISAGEVVERPRNVVKELVENSIDAGATVVNISIQEGGIKSILITDNGSGISRDNIKKAFMPHATSKICNIEDLDKISTLGFRGEALASIASVAQVTIKSKTEDDDAATLYEINGGIEGEVTECALNRGTSIEVKNLFFNTPVRAKFLKKPKSEENEITACVKEFILTNPDIVFIYKVDGKLIYQNSGKSIEDALYSVYPKEIVDNFIPFDEEVHGIRVYGFVASPVITKPTRAYQTIIVNGRFVKDQSLSIAVQNAFQERLMKRTFPVFIINIVVPFDEVDVNVHPSKTEVRFQDSRKIFGAVYRAISTALNMGQTIFGIRQNEIRLEEEASGNNVDLSTNANLREKTNENITIIDDKKEPIVSLSINEGTNHQETINNDKCVSKEILQENNVDDILSDIHYGEKIKEEKPAKKITFEELTHKSYNNKSFIKSNSTPSRVAESPFITKKPIVQQESFIDEGLKDEHNRIILKDYRIVGQIFNTFLILEYKGDVLLIDQHACHERLLYDKLVQEVENNTLAREQLLLPYIVKVSPEDDSFMRDNLKNLDDMGFTVSEFREFQYRVDTIPKVLGGLNLEIFFNDFLSEKNKFKQLKFTELIQNKLATMACKAAIKAGNTLSDEQLKMLLDIFTADEVPLQCPHGRPAVLKITRQDIDKLFKRIV